MAAEQRNWATQLAVAALLFGACAPFCAQSAPSGSLTGKLTDLHSFPLASATVVLRNRATGAQARTTTSGDGSYRFTELAAGEYAIEADSEQLGHGHLNGIFISAGHQARVQSAIEFDQAPHAPVHSVFVATPSGGPKSTLLLTAALPASRTIENPPQRLPMARPIPTLSLDPPPTEIPVLTATLRPTLRQPILFASLPVTATPMPVTAPAPASIPQQPATYELAAINPVVLGPAPALASFVHTLSINPNLAIGASIANGLRAATQWSLPRPNPIQTAVERPDPASYAVTSTLSSAELQSLPATGRRWEDFVLDTPAAAAPAGSSQASLRGSGEQQPDTSVDGASTELAFGATSRSASGATAQTSTDQEVPDPQGIGQVWSGGRFSVSESAVSSVETVAGNVEASGSRAAGGRINVETRRGSNGFHGQSFAFDRQNNWGARNPFTQWVKETTPATSTTVPLFTAQPFTPPDHEITWGLGIGSQIRRNKLFWFAALDSLHRNDPGVSMVKHPYLETTTDCGLPPCGTTTTGFFAQPANDQMQLLGAQLGTTTSAALGRYSQLLEQLGGLLGPAPRTASQWSGFLRLDWEATERHRFALETTGASWNSPGGGLTRVLETYGNHSLGSSQANKQWLLARWEAFLTPNLLTTTQVSVGRTIHSARPGTPSSYEQTLNQNVWGQLPQIVIDSRYGFTIGNPARFGQGNYPDERLFHVEEAVNWVSDRLLLKAGGSLGHNADATGLLRNQTGTYYYSSVANFASDALSFATYGLSGALDKFNPHNCDQTGKAWRDSSGQLRGLGNLPCYSSYSQVMGPTDWHLSTNDLGGFATAQWQLNKTVVLSAGMRWEREQLPPPISTLVNPDLPLAGKMPGLGNNWGPRLSVAIGGSERRWPVISLGYGIYYGRTSNATLENALTRTGSLNGNLNFYMRPTDNLRSGGAPPFPYVFAGEPYTMVKPGAVEFSPAFHNSEIHQAVASFEESLPGHVQVTASALMSLGRRLPITVDTNFDPAVNPGTITYAVVDGTGKGPIKAAQITVPFYATWPSSITGTAPTGRLNPNYQQIAEIFSRANSTYEAAMIKVVRYGRRGLALHAHYTYAHAMDWNPNESSQVMGSNILDPADISREYGVSNLDVRHSAAATIILTSPWKLHNLEGKIANGWMISGIGQFRGGMPFTMRTSGSLPKEFSLNNGDAITALGPGMNGSGGDNRIYGIGSDKVTYNIGRNTFRYPWVWKADLRLSKQFDLGSMRQLQLLAESFNLFNHQNVTQLETTGYYISPGSLNGSFPTLTFLTGLKANTTAFGQPLSINSTNYYRERQIQLGLRMRF